MVTYFLFLVYVYYGMFLMLLYFEGEFFWIFFLNLVWQLEVKVNSSMLLGLPDLLLKLLSSYVTWGSSGVAWNIVIVLLCILYVLIIMWYGKILFCSSLFGVLSPLWSSWPSLSLNLGHFLWWFYLIYFYAFSLFLSLSVPMIHRFNLFMEFHRSHIVYLYLFINLS